MNFLFIYLFPILPIFEPSCCLLAKIFENFLSLLFFSWALQIFSKNFNSFYQQIILHAPVCLMCLLPSFNELPFHDENAILGSRILRSIWCSGTCLSLYLATLKDKGRPEWKQVPWSIKLKIYPNRYSTVELNFL